MNVNLTPELERLIQDKVASGLYNNQSEVVREALRLLEEQDRLRELHVAQLRAALAEGQEQADQEQADHGKTLDGAEVIREMREFLRERRRARMGT